MKNVKKIILSSFVIVTSLGYIFFNNTQNEPTAYETASEISSNLTNKTSTQTTETEDTPPQETTPQGQYADGSYVGTTANAYYGKVQVQANIEGGELVSVDFLKYPNDRTTSRHINEKAMPLLESEAIKAQSADVSGVSGATYTSRAFRESLGDALSQAKN